MEILIRNFVKKFLDSKMSPCKKLGPLHGYLKWLLRCHIFLLIRGLSLSCNTMFAKSLDFNSTGKLDSPAIFAFRMIKDHISYKNLETTKV